jgi:hypothetical protein
MILWQKHHLDKICTNDAKKREVADFGLHEHTEHEDAADMPGATGAHMKS